MFNLPN